MKIRAAPACVYPIESSDEMWGDRLGSARKRVPAAGMGAPAPPPVGARGANWSVARIERRRRPRNPRAQGHPDDTVGPDAGGASFTRPSRPPEAGAPTAPTRPAAAPLSPDRHHRPARSTN
jgi:hypothetical protein